MDYTISDPVGLFLIPFMITLSNNLWNLLNELGIIFVPFLIVLCRVFVTSRALGRDEGSSQIMALKMLEKEWIPMFLVLLLGCAPISTSFAPTISYKAYSCSNTPSLISGVESVNQVMPATTFSNNFGQHNMSAIVGLTHQLSSALNGVFTAKLNCDSGVNRHEVGMSFANASVETKPFVQSILSFDGQCYQTTQDDIRKSYKDGTSTLDNLEGLDRYFNSAHMASAYDGELYSPIKNHRRYYPSNQWKETITDEEIESCNQAASYLETSIRNYLDAESTNLYGKDFNTWKSDIVTLYNQANPSTDFTMEQAEKELIHQVYKNAVERLSKSSFEAMQATVDANNVDPVVAARMASYQSMSAGKPKSSFGSSYHATNSGAIEESKKHVTPVQGALSFAVLWSDFKESLKTMTYIRLAPTLVSTAQGLIIAVLPLILVLSGYSPKILMQICLMYFAISCVPFFLNLGLIFDSTLTGIVNEHSDSVLIDNVDSRTIVSFAGTIAVVLSITAWLTLFQMLGVRLSAMFDALASSSATAANDASSKILKDSTRFIDKQSRDLLDGKPKSQSREEVKARMNDLAESSVHRMMERAGK